MPHPFDNPYAEPEPIRPIDGDNLPSWEQFRDWARRRGINYDVSLLFDIYNSESFRRTLIERNRQEMMSVDA